MMLVSSLEVTCPHCHSRDYHAWMGRGNFVRGTELYRCRACGRTFESYVRPASAVV